MGNILKWMSIFGGASRANAVGGLGGLLGAIVVTVLASGGYLGPVDALLAPLFVGASADTINLALAGSLGTGLNWLLTHVVEKYWPSAKDAEAVALRLAAKLPVIEQTFPGDKASSVASVGAPNGNYNKGK